MWSYSSQNETGSIGACVGWLSVKVVVETIGIDMAFSHIIIRRRVQHDRSEQTLSLCPPFVHHIGGTI